MGLRFPVLCVAIVLLSACALQRSDDAAFAKTHMMGLSKEKVLACMGRPDRKAREGETEVWSYASTDGSRSSTGEGYKAAGAWISGGSSSHNFCTVNIVMTGGEVSAVHYNGPTGSLFAPDEQCGYAVQNCVSGD